MSKLHEELTNTLLQHKQVQKVRSHFTQMSDQLKQELSDLTALEKQLKKEQRDVEKMENKSMRSMFRKILGDREQQLEKERQEYLAVSLKYNELTKSVDLLTYELEILQKKLGDEEQLANRVQVLIQKREKELMQYDPIIGKELMRIHQKLDQTQVVKKDIDEAAAVGTKALQILQRMIAELRKARNWGQYDMMGNRQSAAYVKHRSIDNARNMATQARHYLMRFREELQDVYQDVQLNFKMDLGDFNRFTDIFFDNLISDWIVQQKIKNALNQVSQVAGQVDQVLKSLQDEKPKVDAELASLQELRKKTIVKSDQ
jgi:hypothetical protein